jgi:fructose-1,6-bisphosphatase/inositol monophosphatase family enzyme
MLPAIKSVIEIIKETSEEEILPRFRNLSAEEVRMKDNGDGIVTAADEAAEEMISKRLLELLPGSVVVGEESVYRDKNILSKLGEDAPVWIIDPIDGTTNYSKGDPNFAVIVALQVSREIVAGWIYNPIENTMATAESGAGAWVNEEKVNIATACSLPNMTGAVFGHSEEYLSRAELLKKHVEELHSWGCGGNELIKLIKGDIHFMIKDYSVNPWDYAAGVIMHKEAGGYSAMFDETPYDTAQDYSKSGLLLAPDHESWKNIFKCYMHNECENGDCSQKQEGDES